MVRYIVVPLIRNRSVVTIWTFEILIVLSRDSILPNNELVIELHHGDLFETWGKAVFMNSPSCYAHVNCIFRSSKLESGFFHIIWPFQNSKNLHKGKTSLILSRISREPYSVCEKNLNSQFWGISQWDSLQCTADKNFFFANFLDGPRGSSNELKLNGGSLLGKNECTPQIFLDLE